MTGRLFVVVGPSGAGKDTLLAGATARRPDLHWARRVITRPAAAGGEPYEAETPEGFARRLGQGEFALHWQAHGLDYGVPARELAPRRSGRDVVMNGSRGAIGAILAAIPKARVIVVTAPPALLAARLAARSRETAADVAARLSRAGFDLPQGLAAEVVMNDASPEQGIARLLALLSPADLQQDR
jgi:ribose 1,5-bisphosphokinase